MGYLVLCKQCGYDISSSDALSPAKDIAKATTRCKKCYSKKFKIVEDGEKEITVVGNKDSNKEPDSRQSLLGDMNRDQRYEYAVKNLDSRRPTNLAEELNKYATEGWQLREAIENIEKDSVFYIFERPVKW